MKMSVVVIGMIAHGHNNVQFVHYNVGIFPTDFNDTIASIAKLLHDLEATPKNSSLMLFSITRTQSTLIKVLLDGSIMCLDSLHLLAQELLPT